MTRRPRCTARRYATELDARAALDRIRRPGPRRENRWYFCSQCWGWHLTHGSPRRS